MGGSNGGGAVLRKRPPLARSTAQESLYTTSRATAADAGPKSDSALSSARAVAKAVVGGAALALRSTSPKLRRDPLPLYQGLSDLVPLFAPFRLRDQRYWINMHLSHCQEHGLAHLSQYSLRIPTPSVFEVTLPAFRCHWQCPSERSGKRCFDTCIIEVQLFYSRA